MKEFLAIPILILFYIYFIGVISEINFQSINLSNPSGSSGATVIGVGDAVTVSVTRPYLFGLITLPTYTNSLGNIAIYHDVFFIFIVILTITLIIREIKNRKEKRVIKRRKR